MTSVRETRDETLSLIGHAVTRVAEQAIVPQIAPFKTAMADAIERIEKRADELGVAATQARGERQAVEQRLTELSDQIRQLSEQLDRRNARNHVTLGWLTLAVFLTIAATAAILLVR